MVEYIVTYRIDYDPMDTALGMVKRRYETAPDRTLAADQAAHYEAAKRGRTVEVLSVTEAMQPCESHNPRHVRGTCEENR